LILSGDHHQLSPVVKNRECEQELKESIFNFAKKIITYKPYESKILKSLYIQYRMNEKIMRFSSDYFYYSNLVAHNSVASHTLLDISKIFFPITSLNLGINPYNTDISHIILRCPLILIDTNNLQLYEDEDKNLKSKFNEYESYLCVKIVQRLINLNIKQKDIGIITPYVAQVNSLLDKMKNLYLTDIEIETVDGFQGREKEVIIISCVRSNENGVIGFLNDKNRMNVAITRAKRSAIIIMNTITFYNHSQIHQDHFIRSLCDHLLRNAFPLFPSKILSQEEINQIRFQIHNKKNNEIFLNYNIKSYQTYEKYKNNSISNKEDILSMIKANFKMITDREKVIKNNNYLYQKEEQSIIYNRNSSIESINQKFSYSFNNFEKEKNINNSTRIKEFSHLISKKDLKKTITDNLLENRNEDYFNPNQESTKIYNKNNLANLLIKDNKINQSMNKENFQKINPKAQSFVIQKKDLLNTNDQKGYKLRFTKEINKNDINSHIISNNPNLIEYKSDINKIVDSLKDNKENISKSKKMKKFEKNIKKLNKKNQLYLFDENNTELCIPISSFKSKYFEKNTQKKDIYKKKNDDYIEELKNLQKREYEKFDQNNSLKDKYGISIFNLSYDNINSLNSLETNINISNKGLIDQFPSLLCDDNRKTPNISFEDYSKVEEIEIIDLSQRIHINEENFYLKEILFLNLYVKYLKIKKINHENINIFGIEFVFNYFSNKYELIKDTSIGIHNIHEKLKELKKSYESIEYLNLNHLNYDKKNIIFISDKDQNLVDVMIKILSQKYIGFDSEWVDEKVGTSIFQISTPDKFTYIFELNIDFMKTNRTINYETSKIFSVYNKFFFELFLNEKIIKLSWDFKHDILVLQKRLPGLFKKDICLKSMIDLFDYKNNRNSKDKKNIFAKGFSAYCKDILGYPLDKTFQMSFWDLRPLSEDQLIYAAIDSIATVEIYERMKDKINFISKDYTIN